jgi:hypothetical protein
MRSAILCVSFSLALVLLFAGPFAAFAQTNPISEGLSTVGAAAGLGNADLFTIIGRIINIFLGFLGVILLIIIIYAGFLWMTAGGSAEKIQTAQQWIRNAIIGLVIIVSAYGITQFILSFFVNQGGGGGGNSGQGETIGSFPDQAGALGQCIEMHYPPRNATGVPRNAAIIVTFKRPIRISSIVDGYNDAGTPDDRSDDTVSEALNTNAVRVFRTSDGANAALGGAAVHVRFTDDRRTFVFRPVEYLGSATESVDYTVSLSSADILLDNGRPALSGACSSGYRWSFETSTVIDTTPPRVMAVFPARNQTVAKNAVVQIQFDEAVDPTASTGEVRNGRGFTNIRLRPGDGDTLPILDGAYRVSNQYRTVEFIPGPPACGVNTCGEQVFCLPGATRVAGTVRAATLDGAGPTAAFAAAGYDGVVDVAGNSLDGNADGTAAGPDGDNFTWNFMTTDEINLDPPRIETTMPPADRSNAEGRSNIDPFAPVRVRFNSILMGSSLNTDSAKITAHEPDGFSDTFWWTTSQEYLSDANEPITSSENVPVKSEASILHRTFATSTLYDPYLDSSIRNVYQNCFNPVQSTVCTGGPNCCLNEPSGSACAF